MEDHSDPSEDTYLWAYKVKIKNNSEETVKLVSRHWKIFDSNGNHREVRVKGLLESNLLFNQEMNLSIQVEPTLKTSSGMMHGSYQMQDYKGRTFEVLIPPFSLDIPDNEKKLN